MNHKLKPSDIGSYRKNYMTSWHWFFNVYCDNSSHSFNTYWYFQQLNYSIQFDNFIKGKTLTSNLIRTMYAK